MGKLSLEFQAVLVFCALVLVCSGADRAFFLETTKLPWEKARNLCQVCYTDLVTVTPENIQNIQTLAQNLTSGCWVGLRKNFTTSNSSRIWSHWANGDPLLFQNWYPGWPVFESTESRCCSGSATTDPGTTNADVTAFPTQDMTGFSTLEDGTATGGTDWSGSTGTGLWSSITEGPAFNMTTPAPEEEEECLLPPADGGEAYIEDSCVAMLSFGAWVEKNCWECLPFICYEDRFRGDADVISQTLENATLTWQPAPGNISHYHVEVEGGNETRQFQTNNLTHDLVNLTAGTHYSVQVFAVKCGRNLDAQEVDFYTTPNKVENLEATNVTESSVLLRWNKPDGNVDFYVIEEQDGTQTNSSTVSKEISGLLSGSFYSFTVFSGVQDKSMWSEKSSVTTYTKPGKVSDLRVFDNTEDSLRLSWTSPGGNVSTFFVTATNDRNEILGEELIVWPQTEAHLTNLPNGSRINITVTAWVDDADGDGVMVVNYTAPAPISDLVLQTTQDSLTATWTPPAGTSTTFNVELQLDGRTVDQADNLTESMAHFEELKTAANYTVFIYSFSGHLQGPTVARYKFTKPSPPTKAEVVNHGKTFITYNWTAPENTVTAIYSVRINSSFWGHDLTDYVINTTSYTSRGLTSGTRYDFEVRTVGDGESSSPTPTLSHCTDAEKREISLAMLCSSAEPLLCDEKATREDVFLQLKEHFKAVFRDFIFWELEKKEN